MNYNLWGREVRLDLISHRDINMKMKDKLKREPKVVNNFWNMKPKINIKGPVQIKQVKQNRQVKKPFSLFNSKNISNISKNTLKVKAYSFKPKQVHNSISTFRHSLKTPYKRTKAEAKLIKVNPWGDRDGDGVPNWIDCRPFNRKRQGKVSDIFSSREEKDMKTFKGIKKDLQDVRDIVNDPKIKTLQEYNKIKRAEKYQEKYDQIKRINNLIYPDKELESIKKQMHPEAVKNIEKDEEEDYEETSEGQKDADWEREKSRSKSDYTGT